MKRYALTIRAHAMPWLAMRLLQEDLNLTARVVLENYVRAKDPDQMVIMEIGPLAKKIMDTDQYLFIRGSVTEYGKDTEGRTARDSGHAEDQDAADGRGGDGGLDTTPQ